MALSEFVGTIGSHPQLLAAADGVRALLQTNDLFNDAPAEDLDRLGFEFKPAAYENSSYLQRQGEMGEYFSLLVEGNVKVTQNAKVKGPRGEYERERHVINLVPGDFVGERSMLSGEPAIADVVAQGAVTTLRLDKAGFAKMPESALAVLRNKRYVSLMNEAGYDLAQLKLHSVLGVGAYGVVGFVEDLPTGGKFALKMIDRELVVKKKQQKHIM